MYKMQKSPDAPKLSPRRIRLRVKKRTRKSSDKDIKEISDGVNGLTLESKSETKIPTRKLNKRQKTSKSVSSDFISKYLERPTKAETIKVEREVEKLIKQNKKCQNYKFNEEFPIQHWDDYKKHRVAVIPIIPDSVLTEPKHSPSKIDIEKISIDAPIVQKYDININPLLKYYTLFTSYLTARDGSIVFYPEEKFSKFFNKNTDTNSKSKSNSIMDADEEGVETKNKWENLDSETILKILKNVFNIVSKKTKKIIKTKYIQYSPHLGVFLIILKGKEYKLKNKKFGDKHYPWRWSHNWDHYNNWIPDYVNKVYRRIHSPYLCKLVSDVSMAYNDIKYRIDGLDKDVKPKEEKWLYHKMTWRFIYEELAK